MSDRRIDSVRVAWLQAFLMVAKYQSYSEAAQVLRCDQSTISRYMIQLQKWLRKGLVAGYAPTTLTPAGEDFYPKAVEICRLLEESREPEPRPRVRARDIKFPAAEGPPPAPKPTLSAAHIDMSAWIRLAKKDGDAS